MTEILSTTIADTIWNSGSKDVRDLLKVGKLARCPEDVGWLISTLRKYSVKEGNHV
jgi:hypothetical protein